MVQHQYLVYIKILGFQIYYNEKFIIITQNSSLIPYYFHQASHDKDWKSVAGLELFIVS